MNYLKFISAIAIGFVLLAFSNSSSEKQNLSIEHDDNYIVVEKEKLNEMMNLLEAQRVSIINSGLDTELSQLIFSYDTYNISSLKSKSHEENVEERWQALSIQESQKEINALVDFTKARTSYISSSDQASVRLIP